jgi:HPt (histidine-containing phosphotransfer) domain-containing protein
MDQTILKQHGIRYEDGVQRCMGDNELYETVLVEFLEDTTVAVAAKALQNQDWQGVFDQLHTLKGVAGNLDMADLYADSCALVEKLRNNAAPDATEIARDFSALKSRYEFVQQGIRLAMKQG